jgi:hypothetical protein
MLTAALTTIPPFEVILPGEYNEALFRVVIIFFV